MKWGMLGMQSKISLAKREMGKIIARSVGWVSIFYFLGLFIAIPLEILMEASNQGDKRYYFRPDNLFQYNAEIQSILSITLPVLLAIFLFRFLHSKRFSDFMHSLPIKRNQIYHFFTLSGIVILLVPIIVITLIVLGLYGPMQLNEFLSIKDIFTWAGVTSLFNLVIYLVAIFVGMNTGLSAVQGALTYILLLLPIGLLILLGFNLPFYLYGFPDEYFMDRKIEAFSPLVALSLINNREIGTTEIVIYSFIIVVVYALSLWIYKRRKLEAVTQAIVFPFLKPIFKYGVTFCTMLFGGMYFGKMEGGTLWLVTGYVFGGMVGFFIAEMVLQKTWRIVVHIRGLLIYACSMAVLVVLFQFDFTNYEKYIPNSNEIERVHFSQTYYRFSDRYEEAPSFLTETETIDLVRRLHKEIIRQKGQEQTKTEHAFFVYELKNGKRVVRDYQIDVKKFAQYYKLIYETDEYKRETNEIFKVNADQVEKITIQPYSPVNKRAVIINPEDMKEAVAILKEEIKNQTYEDLQDPRDSYSSIEFLQQNEKTISMGWRVTYKKFEQWLDEKGLLEDARIHASDISYAYIAPTDEIAFDYRGYSHEEISEQIKKHPKALKITDKTKLDTILEKTQGYIDGPYVVAIYYKNDGFIDIKSFSSEQVPEYIKLNFE